MRITKGLEKLLYTEDGLWLSSILFGLSFRATFELNDSSYAIPLSLITLGIGYGTLKSMIHSYYAEKDEN